MEADLRPPPVTGCRCATCMPNGWYDGGLRSRMILCPSCGNKRCPHATDHRLACTGSNEAGQIGSDYGYPLSEAEKVARVRFRSMSPKPSFSAADHVRADLPAVAGK